MKLVLLFFCACFLLLLFLIAVLLLSEVRLNVKKLKIDNTENAEKKLDTESLIYLELFLFGKIKIAKINLNKKIFKKINLSRNLEDLKKDKEVLEKIKKLEILKILNLKVNKLEFELKVGTFDMVITTFLVTFLSISFGILLKNLDYRNVRYRIGALYKLENAINLNGNCIISTKMVHIVYAIYILIKKGRIENERTSNRRAYDYSYE